MKYLISFTFICILTIPCICSNINISKKFSQQIKNQNYQLLLSADSLQYQLTLIDGNLLDIKSEIDSVQSSYQLHNNTCQNIYKEISKTDWWSIISTTLALMAIGFTIGLHHWQQKKEKKDRQEEYSIIGQTLYLLLIQLKNALYQELNENDGFRACVTKLKEDNTSKPNISFIPAHSITRLKNYSPEILYKIFQNSNISNENFHHYFLSIDQISTEFDFCLKNYNEVIKTYSNLTCDFAKIYKEFNKITFNYLSISPVSKTYTYIQDIIGKKIQVDRENYRFIIEEIISPIHTHLKSLDSDFNSREYELCDKATNLISIYMKIQNSNTRFCEVLECGISHIDKAQTTLFQIAHQLKERKKPCLK